MNFKKMFKVVFVDFMALFVGILNGFLLPKFLTIDSYAYIKTFTLYIGYSGIFHLGFSDGIYILLGGKSINDINKEKIKGYVLALLKILSLVSICFIIINIFIIKDIIFTCFILYTIPFQVILFVSLLYRATGEFDKYIIIRSIINVFSLLSTLSTLFILKSPVTYIAVQIIGYVILALIYLSKIIIVDYKAEKIKISEIKLLINTGFIVMIANTVNNIFFSLDRWIVKLNFTTKEFAYYSFGVSMLSLFTSLISSVTIVFYPYLARNHNDETIVQSIKKYIILICSFAPSGYFILEVIVSIILPQYVESLEVLGILILSIPFMTAINVVYLNLYKSTNRGKEYLYTAIKILALALTLNICVIYFGGRSNSVAYSTLISLIIWYTYSSRHFKGLEIKKNEIIYLIIYIFMYVFIKQLEYNSILKAVIFTIIIIINICIFFRAEICGLIKLVLNKNEK